MNMHLVSIHATHAARDTYAAHWMKRSDEDCAAYLERCAWESFEKAAAAFGAKLVKIEQVEAST